MAMERHRGRMIDIASTFAAPPLTPGPSHGPTTAAANFDGGIALSIIVPTFNEAGNIVELIRRIDATLEGANWEVLVVDDDSPDGTSSLVLELGRRDERIRCLHRVGRRGLSSACLEGMALARGRYYAVMDADLQHDERLLPAMLLTLSTGDTDLVVGSRYVDGGCVEAWHPLRLALSRAATFVTCSLLRVNLSDPMSGFFMIRSEAVLGIAARGSGKGFKLLLDLVASSPVPLRVVELPYRFAVRQSGRSKLGVGVVWHFLLLLMRQAMARIPRRFVQFCVIGASGVLVHLSILWAAQRWLQASSPAAQTGAVLVSIVSNYWLNNRLAFTDVRLVGARFLTGMSRFAALCALGAIVNVAVAASMHQAGVARMPFAMAGILVGALCNYLAVSRFVWRL
jgi:dolichol-phosphate mannosyltransferase